MIVAGLALVSSAAFSIGEVSGSHHHSGVVNADQPNAPAAAPSALSGLSISGLQNLQSEVSQAAALAQGASDGGASNDLSQLEQQLGISPSASTSDQAEQLQAELNAINACLSGSSTATPAGC